MLHLQTEDNKYFESNQHLWDQWTGVHLKSRFYDVDGFKAGRNTLDPVELAGLGDVRGKSVLHLQCHFGMDSLSLARMGARVTGLDLSPEAIKAARALSQEIGVSAEFVQANVYDAAQVLSGRFDLVFTSHGAIYWLPDLRKWAQVIADLLRPGGTFFIADGHPFAAVFETEGNVTGFEVKYPYFHSDAPMRWEVNGSYADPTADVHGVEYGWQHSLSDVLNALRGAGLRIEELREYPFVPWPMFPFLEKREDGWWHLPAQFIQIPLMFSLVATKL